MILARLLTTSAITERDARPEGACVLTATALATSLEKPLVGRDASQVIVAL
jgi:hypothetical protein